MDVCIPAPCPPLAKGWAQYHSYTNRNSPPPLPSSPLPPSPPLHSPPPSPSSSAPLSLSLSLTPHFPDFEQYKCKGGLGHTSEWYSDKPDKEFLLLSIFLQAWLFSLQFYTLPLKKKKKQKTSSQIVFLS